MKKIAFYVLIIFFLESCSNTNISPTIAPSPTSTPASTITDRPTFTPTETPSPTPTETPSPTSTIIPTATEIGGGSGKFLIGLEKAGFKEHFPDLKGQLNIFILNMEGRELTPVTNGLKGFNYFQNISPNGKMTLVSSFLSQIPSNGDLYLVNLNMLDSNPIKLAGGLTNSISQAIFLDNTRIVYLGKGKTGFGIYIVNVDGTNPIRISSPDVTPFSLVGVNEKQVFWNSRIKKRFINEDGFAYTYGDFYSLWWTNIDGSGQGKLESNGKQLIPKHYTFSKDGKNIAWIPVEKEPNCSYETFLTGWIRDGVYTKHAGETSPGVFNKHKGEVIDMEYVDAYVHRCFILYVSSLSDMDNPTKIVLMPPKDLIDGDFSFERDYYLTWWPDGSKIMLFNQGSEVFNYLTHKPVLYSVNPRSSDSTLQEEKGLFTFDQANKISMGSISPDGEQIIVFVRSQDQKQQILNFATKGYFDLFNQIPSAGKDNSYIRNVDWLP